MTQWHDRHRRRGDRGRSDGPPGFDSPWLLALPALVLLALALWVNGCQGRVGACSGRDCPQLPGCEGETAVLCDPEHVCLERVCEGVGWICGVDEQGTYAWSRMQAPCDDQDPCTAKDTCVNGQCQGTRRECKAPPANLCVNSTLLRSWDTVGLCQGGECAYASQDLGCNQGCANGTCVGSPCIGVKCDAPPGACHASPGTCLEGKCRYDPLAANAPCTSTDPCQTGATCDVQGSCRGTSVDCARPHTTGATCVQKACQGYQCEAGWGDCNSKWDDGCETKLDSTTHCGKCNAPCKAAANATVACTAGKCVLTCTSPWKDCDGKVDNGCEIPAGVANRCNVKGLASFSGSTPPCGTPHCGSGSGANVTSFGTWFCSFCEHCHTFGASSYSWCLGPAISGQGNFSSARCGSGCCNPDNNEVCN